jgi:lysophospholipase L1-like esterase
MKRPLISAQRDMLSEDRSAPAPEARLYMLRILSITALLSMTVPALAQDAAAPDASQRLIPAPATDAGSPGFRIEWEVKNRFRLFKNEADFQRHVAASRGDGVLAAEQRLAAASEGHGWARDMVDNLCIDQSGRIPEFCQRGGERENYMAPADYPVGVLAAGDVPPGASCTWSFDDGQSAPRQVTVPCEEEVRLRVRADATTVATLDIPLSDGTAQRVTADIQVKNVLIAGMGDSIAAGEGNPDRAVALDDGGFCFRRFLAGSTSEYFRPGRANFRGSKACDQGFSVGNTSADWAKLNARWWSATCHRSLYGYQLRAALALAIEQPHIAVTFLPLACSGSTIELGFFGSLRARECPASGYCTTNNPSQMSRLQEAMQLARKHDRNRKLDLVLLTIGANDIWFAGLVADVIIEAPTERTLFTKGGMITSVPEAEKILDKDLPADFARLRAALKPFVGGDLSRVVFVTYGNPALHNGGQVCPGGLDGFDVHPAFNADPARLKRVAEFVERKFLPGIRSLALCEGKGCKDPATERMTFVDSHQDAFASHGFCARAETDPPFDRACFTEKGDGFENNPAIAAIDPLKCEYRARDFRPYASRARWVRTANDSYFTAMTFPEGISPVLQPSDLHDATWGATSAVYGGAIHPTAEGHAAMADAALPALRGLLELQAPAQIIVEPLAPLTAPAVQ